MSTASLERLPPGDHRLHGARPPVDLAARGWTESEHVASGVATSTSGREAAYALADPTLLVPAPCPVWAVQAEDDQVVPRSQAVSYVEAARAAGGQARLVEVPGDHFALIDPGAACFATIRPLLGD